MALRGRGLQRGTALRAATLGTAVTLATIALAITGGQHVQIRQVGSAEPLGAAAPEQRAAHTTSERTTVPLGLCSVPGIGDIGGLLGLCSLGSSGLIGAVNSICEPAPPTPESATGGIDALIAPPGSGRKAATLYGQYGMAGTFWAATGLRCSDMTAQVGNDVAGMVLDAAKAVDRVTITLYQTAAGDQILGWLSGVTDRLVSAIGRAIYFPYLAAVIVLGALWLAWHGLVRKRGTRTIEGTIWMILACTAAMVLIGQPSAITRAGSDISGGIAAALDTAFAKLPSPSPSGCIPVRRHDPQARPLSYAYTSGSTVVAQNADELWTVLVCKPWLDGEFGTTSFGGRRSRQSPVSSYGRQLLWSQAIAANERATREVIKAKQSTYVGIASAVARRDPGVYSLFQGRQWTTRLEIGFAALLAALATGILVLLISLTLIVLKLGFLLLLVVGPFFLLVGTHPGFGRVIAVRWVELLVGVLLKQAAVALTLSLLLYCYALIMGSSDATLPWVLKIVMISLVTVSVFIFRKPLQHLFTSVGHGFMGSGERAEQGFARSRATLRENAVALGTVAVPGFAAYRIARWTRRNPEQAVRVAATAAPSSGARKGSRLRAVAAMIAEGSRYGSGGVAGRGYGTDDDGTADAADPGLAPPLSVPGRDGQEQPRDAAADLGRSWRRRKSGEE